MSVNTSNYWTVSDLTLDAKEILVPKRFVLLDPKSEHIRRAYDAVPPIVEQERGDVFWDIPPGGSALALTVETIDMTSGEMFLPR